MKAFKVWRTTEYTEYTLVEAETADEAVAHVETAEASGEWCEWYGGEYGDTLCFFGEELPK